MAAGVKAPAFIERRGPVWNAAGVAGVKAPAFIERLVAALRTDRASAGLRG